jgi:hypothetical protein
MLKQEAHNKTEFLFKRGLDKAGFFYLHVFNVVGGHTSYHLKV